MLIAICPVCGSQMKPHWWLSRPRFYCSNHCRSRGAAIARLERDRENLDEVVVDRLMRGKQVESTQAERMEAAARLSRQADTGMNAAGTYRRGRWGNVVVPTPDALMTTTEIAKRIGVSHRTAGQYLRNMAEPTRLLTPTEVKAKAMHASWLLHVKVIDRLTVVGWLIPNEGE